ncbi:MAG: hypothetical protein ABR511_00920 [Acidimicrobiales bacterium]
MRTSIRPAAVRRGWAVASLALVASSLAASPGTARAAGGATPSLSITASPATTVGLSIFANSNLMGGANPTGTLTFTLFGPDASACTAPIFTSTVAVTGQSTNSASYPTTRAGTYRWQSAYSGDAANAPVGPTSCADPSGAVVVGKARTTLAVSAPSPVGGTIHGTVALGGGAGPTGSVTFQLSPPGDTFCATTVFTSTVAVNGTGSYSSGPYTPTTTGSFRWRASYTGDANSLGTSITACIDPADVVTVSTVAPQSTTTTTMPPSTTTTTRPTTTTTIRPTTTTTVAPTTTTRPTTTTTVAPSTTTTRPTTTTTMPPATTTTTTVPPPPTSAHWGPYAWGTTASSARAFWLFDRTGSPAMHAALSTWVNWWNGTRAGVDPALPLVAVYVDDAYAGQCFETANPAYSLAMVCAGGTATPVMGAAAVPVAAGTAHIVSPVAVLRPGLDAATLATSVCRQMGALVGLHTTTRTGSCMSAAPAPGVAVGYDAGDIAFARSVYDSHPA